MLTNRPSLHLNESREFEVYHHLYRTLKWQWSTKAIVEPFRLAQHAKLHCTSSQPSLLRSVTGPPSPSSVGFGIALASMRGPILTFSARKPTISYPKISVLISPRISANAKLRPGHRCAPPPKGIYAARRFFSVSLSTSFTKRSGLKSSASTPHTSDISCVTLADHMMSVPCLSRYCQYSELVNVSTTSV